MTSYRYFDTTWKGRKIRFITGGPELETDGRIEKLFELFKSVDRLVIIEPLVFKGGTAYHSGDPDLAKDFRNNFDMLLAKKWQLGTI